MSLENMTTSISNEQIEPSTDSDRKATLRNNNQTRVSRMRSENTNVARVHNNSKTCGLQHGYSNAVWTSNGNAKIQPARRIPNERNSFGMQRACISNAVGTSHNKSSADSPMVKDTGSTERKIQTSQTKSSTDSPMVKASGSTKRTIQTSQTKSSTDSPMVKATGSSKEKIQSGQAQRHQPTQKKKDTAPPVKKSLTHTNSTSRQKKKKSQPSKSSSEQQSKETAPEYHIVWDGFDEPCEPVGLNCCLCDGDLAYSPVGLESERYDFEEEGSFVLFEEVSFLPCGHAFHSKCLQLITSEEQSRGPSCFICVTGLL